MKVKSNKNKKIRKSKTKKITRRQSRKQLNKSIRRNSKRNSRKNLKRNSRKDKIKKTKTKKGSSNELKFSIINEFISNRRLPKYASLMFNNSIQILRENNDIVNNLSNDDIFCLVLMLNPPDFYQDEKISSDKKEEGKILLNQFITNFFKISKNVFTKKLFDRILEDSPIRRICLSIIHEYLYIKYYNIAIEKGIFLKNKIPFENLLGSGGIPEFFFHFKCMNCNNKLYLCRLPKTGDMICKNCDLGLEIKLGRRSSDKVRKSINQESYINSVMYLETGNNILIPKLEYNLQDRENIKYKTEQPIKIDFIKQQINIAKNFLLNEIRLNEYENSTSLRNEILNIDNFCGNNEKNGLLCGTTIIDAFCQNKICTPKFTSPKRPRYSGRNTSSILSDKKKGRRIPFSPLNENQFNRSNFTPSNRNQINRRPFTPSSRNQNYRRPFTPSSKNQIDRSPFSPITNKIFN